MSNVVRLNPKFDYKEYGLEHLAQEADETAITFLKRLDELGNLTVKLILEDAPKLKKIQLEMKQKGCWLEWLDKKFEKSKSTAYNILEIYNVVETCAETERDRILEEITRWSQRALMALWATGDNRQVALDAFIGKQKPTQKQVESFKPIDTEQKEELLEQIRVYAIEEELGIEDPEMIKLRVENRAKEFAKNQNKRVPGLEDYQRAFAQVTGKEPKPLTGVRTRVTAQQYQDLLEATREKDEVINQQKEELAEAYAAIRQLEKDRSELSDRVKQLEQRLQKAGVAA